VYILGKKLPDPESGVPVIREGGRDPSVLEQGSIAKKHREDPPLTPKRDPPMCVGGNYASLRSIEGQSVYSIDAYTRRFGGESEDDTSVFRREGDTEYDQESWDPT
jgi:hypothetical protein